MYIYISLSLYIYIYIYSRRRKVSEMYGSMKSGAPLKKGCRKQAKRPCP